MDSSHATQSSALRTVRVLRKDFTQRTHRTQSKVLAHVALLAMRALRFSKIPLHGPDRTRTDFFLRRNSVGSVRVADKVRAGLVGSV